MKGGLNHVTERENEYHRHDPTRCRQTDQHALIQPVRDFLATLISNRSATPGTRSQTLGLLRHFLLYLEAMKD